MTLLRASRARRSTTATRDERRSLVWVGLFLAAVYWVLESVVHVVVFGQGEFLPQLLTLDPHEIWKRLFVALLLVAFSLYAQSNLDRRKRYERSLRSAHAELNQIFQTASAAMRLIDRRHRVLKVNETFSVLSGVDADDAVGARCSDIFAGDLCKTHLCPLERILEGAAEVNCEVDKTRRDGSRVTCALTAKPFLDQDGGLLGIVESFHDLTQTKAAQAAAIHSEQLAALGELAAGVAHEINNPINGIINYGEILSSRHRDSKTVQEVAAQIVREGGRVANIVESLLSFARRDSRQRQVTELCEVLERTFTLTAAQLRKDDIRLELDLADDLPSIVCVPQEIEQVFMNLLNNSRYALLNVENRATERRLTVVGDCVTDAGGCWIRISMRDNGTGIPQNCLDNVTHPFFSTKPRGKGTGLGLSISDGIVTDHGGRLQIESVEGEYTRVIVLLPVLRTHSEVKLETPSEVLSVGV